MKEAMECPILLILYQQPKDITFCLDIGSNSLPHHLPLTLHSNTPAGRRKFTMFDTINNQFKNTLYIRELRIAAAFPIQH